MENTMNLKQKSGLFATFFGLLLVIAVGYLVLAPQYAEGASKNNDSSAYYKQLVYVVTEMNKQTLQLDKDVQSGKASSDQIRKGLGTVEDLWKPIGQPSEEVSVSYSIAKDVHQAYLDLMQTALDHANANLADSPDYMTKLKQERSQYRLFRQNFYLVSILNSYGGVNIDCH